MNKMYKQAIVIRTDLNMSRGKLCSQSAHASLEAALKTQKTDKIFKTKNLNAWRKEGAKKIVLKVMSESALIKIRDKAVRAGLKSALIKDAGFTELPAGTITAIAIGPDKEKEIDKITSNLSTL
ncbi:peptidyl-tRNA hydrolase [Candidatus Woesearchaeota archaeon]|nr:peptidyl-tRNA hydrolase [Candidatus Woesearchaeota archaeon]